MKLVLDANVFLNVIFEEKPFLETSRRLLKEIEAKRLDAYLSSITLAEIVWIVYKESGFRKAREVQSYLRELSELQIVKVIPLEESIVYGILTLIEKYNLSFVDALLVSTAINSKSVLVTRDEKIKKVKEVKVKIPDELV
ncbi:MAG: type II toxin-antitoxin system VapC family toxin [Candidatus Brockarchaeota archaeon]|nr:type II toxin-antitoxin system VapC family toxin [Candidatus Brockarchaeota archaeon]